MPLVPLISKHLQQACLLQKIPNFLQTLQSDSHAREMAVSVLLYHIASPLANICAAFGDDDTSFFTLLKGRLHKALEAIAAHHHAVIGLRANDSSNTLSCLSHSIKCQEITLFYLECLPQILQTSPAKQELKLMLVLPFKCEGSSTSTPITLNTKEGIWKPTRAHTTSSYSQECFSFESVWGRT